MPLRKLVSQSALTLVLAGAASTVVFAGETITYTYDSLGRLIVAKSTGTINDNQAFSYCYDAAGNRTLVRTNTAGWTANCSTAPSPTPTPTPTPTPAPSISIGNASAMEGYSMNFTVWLSEAHTSSISVNYATQAGSAGAYDFNARSGTLTFSAGQTSKTISVSTKQDITPEPLESFTINLSGPTGGATISDGQGVGTITDDGDNEPTCGEFLC